LNEAAAWRNAAHDYIWQGNCDVAAQTARSNDAELRITNPIEIPNKISPENNAPRTAERAFSSLVAAPKGHGELYRKVTRRSGLVSVREESRAGSLTIES